LTARPLAIARRLLLVVPQKIAEARDNVDPRQRKQIKLAGASEWLAGYRVVTAGVPEIAEMALAMTFDHGVDAVTLTRLTDVARTRLAKVFPAKAVPFAPAANALVSLSLTLPDSAGLAQVEPAFRATSLRDLGRYVQEGGTSAWLAVFAQPIGMLNLLWKDKELARELRLPTTLPSEVSFNLLDLAPRTQRPSFQLRGRLPKGDAAVPSWVSLAKLFGQSLDENDSDVHEEAQPDATWITWRQGLKRVPVNVPLRLAKEPAGTFALVHIDFPALADRLDQKSFDDYAGSDHAVAQTLRLLGQGEAKARLGNGWVMGEMRLGAAEGAPLVPYEPLLPKPATATVQPTSTPGQLALAFAVAQSQRMLNALASVELLRFKEIMARGRAEFARDLAQAKQDKSTMIEAAALDRLLLTLTQD